MSLYDKMNIGFGPGFGVGVGKLFNLKPTDGTGDFTVTRADTDASELVTNGSFATDTDWTKGSGWSISGGVATSTGAIGDLEQTSLGVTLGVSYYVEVTTSGGSYNGSGLIIKLGGDDVLATITEDGTYEFKLTVGAGANNNILFSVATTNAFIGNIDDVSVKSADFSYAATRINADGKIEGVRPNKPRSSFPNGGSGNGCPFLLIEPARTNDILRSEDFSTTWTDTNVIMETDQANDPGGGVGADKPNETAFTAEHTIQQNVTGLTNATAHVFSCFFKADERDQMRLEAWSGYADFNLTSGTVSNETSITSAGIENYGDGWYRCHIVKTSTATSTDCKIYMLDANGNSSYSGTLTYGFYMWGAMLEEGGYLTSYIPTVGSAVSRAKDQVSNAGDAGDFKESSGTLIVQFAALSDDLTNRVISVSDGSTSDKITIEYSTTTNTIEAKYVSLSSTVDTLTYQVADITDWVKVGFRYDATNGFSLWVDGGEEDTGTFGVGAATFTELSFDDGSAGGNQYYGKVYNLMYFDSWLTDDEMQYLTLANNFLFEDGEAFLFD